MMRFTFAILLLNVTLSLVSALPRPIYSTGVIPRGETKPAVDAKAEQLKPLNSHKIHEFQAKKLFKTYGIPVEHGTAAMFPEVYEIAKNLGPKVIKAKPVAGDRGKGTSL